MQYIALLDCNNFFVSCERLFRPDLQKTPVVVLSSNDGCVVARSQEIKDMGISMGTPHFQIKDILSQSNAVVFSSHFALYRDISRRVMTVLRSLVSCVEQYSIDEAFFIIESTNPIAEAERIKNEVERLCGVPVSLGIAQSKTQAKYANSVAKKTKRTIHLDAVWWSNEGKDVVLSSLWGVGRGRSRHFESLGIRSVGDLCTRSDTFVETNFGIEGQRLRAELSSVAVYAVDPVPKIKKSSTSSRSFARLVYRKEVLQNAIRYHLHNALTVLWLDNLLTQKITLFLGTSRHGDYVLQGSSASLELGVPTRNIFILEQAVSSLVEKAYTHSVPYKKVGIILSGLQPCTYQTPSLFGDDFVDKTDQVSDTVMTLQQRFGSHIMQVGRVGGLVGDAAPHAQYCSPAYTTNVAEIKVVTAR